MFAIPLAGRGERPPITVRLAAASGLAMTLAFALLSIFPVVDVKSSASFTVKVMLLIFAINAAGALYFRYATRRRMALEKVA